MCQGAGRFAYPRRFWIPALGVLFSGVVPPVHPPFGRASRFAARGVEPASSSKHFQQNRTWPRITLVSLDPLGENTPGRISWIGDDRFVQETQHLRVESRSSRPGDRHPPVVDISAGASRADTPQDGPMIWWPDRAHEGGEREWPCPESDDVVPRHGARALARARPGRGPVGVRHRVGVARLQLCPVADRLPEPEGPRRGFEEPQGRRPTTSMRAVRTPTTTTSATTATPSADLMTTRPVAPRRRPASPARPGRSPRPRPQRG